MPASFEKLSKSLQKFGKENLTDILHLIATGLIEKYQCDIVRIFLEDLYEGMLVCHYVTGEDRMYGQRITQSISPKESIISRAFYENNPVFSWEVSDNPTQRQGSIEKVFGIKSSAIFPITSSLHPIGVLSLDWRQPGEFLTPSQSETVVSFLANNSPIIEKAKGFHQKIGFSKHLDLARKKEAALMMVRSAVKLINPLTLASVLVPAITQNTEEGSTAPDDMVEFLAVYSKNEEDIQVYHTKDRMSILNDRNLLNQIVRFESSKGLIAKDPDKKFLYIEDVRSEQFARKTIAKKIDLVSLYQIPKYNQKTGRFICAINYYTDSIYKFNAVEKRLLKEHASMVERIILEEGPARIEIQVLSEIEELLSDPDTSLQAFLNKILDKTSELLGADSGSISLVKIIEGIPWLIVEDDQGGLIGAKSHGFKKNRIPPLMVGGEELPPENRSLTGYCAYSAKSLIVSDVQDQTETQGFYKNLSSSIRSELAIPIIFGNHVLGIINQDSFIPKYFTNEHKHILQIVSRLINQKVYNLIQIQDLKKEINYLTRDIEYRDPKVSSYYLGNVIGKSRNIHSLVNQIDTVVESICNRMLHWEKSRQPETLMGLPSLLLTGQTGTGKEFFFNNIYSRLRELFQKTKNPQFKLPIKKTNIAAYSGELSYSELFGHKKGAFTGAESHRQGILEEADGGVVFLDEIGDTDPKTQVQLLRYLDTGVFVRLGENAPRYSKIFLIAATNKNLLEEIQQGRFREDLYHRLNELSFQIPSLNQRKEDIEDLAIHFLGKLYMTYKNDQDERPPPYLEPDALDYLRSYNYRGNVRELRNILMRAMLFRKDPGISRDSIISASKLNPSLQEQGNHLKSENKVEQVLDALDSGSSDFWSAVHRPFKNKELTRDMVKSIIQTAKTRYHTNLPGLAVKFGVCGHTFKKTPEENQKFISFKNFLYKTVRLTEN